MSDFDRNKNGEVQASVHLIAPTSALFFGPDVGLD